MTFQHPNIVAALDAGEVDSPSDGGPTMHYLVMEYVRGDDLRRVLQREGPFSASRTVQRLPVRVLL